MKAYKIHFLFVLSMAISFTGYANDSFSKSNDANTLRGEISNPIPQQEGFVFINKRKSGEYIGETSGRAMTMKVYKTTGNTKILWVTEDAGGGYVRIKNVGNGKYLHCERGGLQIGDIEQGWQSAQWRIEKKDGYVRIQNKFNSMYLNNQNEILELSKMKKKGGDSALWKMRKP